MKTIIDYRLFIHIIITLVFSYYSINKRQEYDNGWVLIVVAVLSFSWVVVSLINNVKQTGIFYKKIVYSRDDLKKEEQKSEGRK